MTVNTMQKKKQKNPELARATTADKLFYAISTFVLALFALIVLLPLINVISSSFSDGDLVTAGKVMLLPKKPTLMGYKTVFNYNGIWRAYSMTFFYTILGTAINLFMTMICAYGMAQKELPMKKPLMAMMVFTMFFSGGTIPSYIVVMKLGMLNTIWSIVIPGAMSVYNMILARTFIMGIPDELWEAASIDGCTEFQYFAKVTIPLSGTIMVVLMLYYGVGHWNSYFSAMLYLDDYKLYPLQLILRQILILNESAGATMDEKEAHMKLANIMRYALIIVASVPVLVMYPMAKKHFAKGVMLGSVKG